MSVDRKGPQAAGVRNYVSDRVFDGVRPIDERRLASIKRSFFDGLTKEQKKFALEYDGPESHGDPNFARLRTCPNIERSREGFDGEKLKCGVCGYYWFIEGRYYKWVPPNGNNPDQPACAASSCS